MKELSLEKQIYLCKYAEIDTLGISQKKAKEILDKLKSKGLYEKYKNMPEEEYERIIQEEKRDKYRKENSMNENTEENVQDNSLLDLNNILFDQLRKLNSDNLTQDELDTEIKISKQVVSVSQTIINNSNLLLQAKKHFDQTKQDGSKIAPLLNLDKG